MAHGAGIGAGVGVRPLRWSIARRHGTHVCSALCLPTNHALLRSASSQLPTPSQWPPSRGLPGGATPLREETFFRFGGDAPAWLVHSLVGAQLGWRKAAHQPSSVEVRWVAPPERLYAASPLLVRCDFNCLLSFVQPLNAVT